MGGPILLHGKLVDTVVDPDVVVTPSRRSTPSLGVFSLRCGFLSLLYDEVLTRTSLNAGHERSQGGLFILVWMTVSFLLEFKSYPVVKNKTSKM